LKVLSGEFFGIHLRLEICPKGKQFRFDQKEAYPDTRTFNCGLGSIGFIVARLGFFQE